MNNLVIRTKEKGRVTYSFQGNSLKSLDDIISFELLSLDENLLLSNIIANQGILSLSKSDTVIIITYL